MVAVVDDAPVTILGNPKRRELVEYCRHDNARKVDVDMFEMCYCLRCTNVDIVRKAEIVVDMLLDTLSPPENTRRNYLARVVR